MNSIKIFDHIFKILNEMYTFLEKQIQQYIQKEIENFGKQIGTGELNIYKNKKVSGPYGFAVEFYQTFKDESFLL